jgi:hypothetical protein
MIYFFFKITFLKYIIFFCCFDNKMIIYCSIVHWIKSDNNKNNILKTIIIWIEKKKMYIFNQKVNSYSCIPFLFWWKKCF